MKLRPCTYGLTMLACVSFVAIPAALARAADCQDLTWSKDRLSKFDVALAKEQGAAKQGATATPASQNGSSEFDAAIASLEQDLATRRGDAAVKGEAVLRQIRATRDAYRATLRQPAIHITRAAQATDAPEESANAFWSKVNEYLDAVNADVATRQAAMQTQFVGN